MVRLARAELFHSGEVAVIHVMNRVVRRCFLLGSDSVSGKSFDHRKEWIEAEIKRSAANFAIDLIAFSLMSNHLHMVLRQRPDVGERCIRGVLTLRQILLESSRDGNRRRYSYQASREPSPESAT